MMFIGVSKMQQQYWKSNSLFTDKNVLNQALQDVGFFQRYPHVSNSYLSIYYCKI